MFIPLTDTSTKAEVSGVVIDLIIWKIIQVEWQIGPVHTNMETLCKAEIFCCLQTELSGVSVMTGHPENIRNKDVERPTVSICARNHSNSGAVFIRSFVHV
ncbi:hypothetical protein CHARACLAT_014695 [Characodon lateralis]|uniref:Uncharacterized protein n=1 Tax=Characodon lateralis TaxID=208331 RepID=A0ABU7ETR4_9TELE|nr:hypothetical protein [Characodon lateralis]